MDNRLHLILVNPLGAALSHYTASLEQILVDCDATVTSVTQMEPSVGGQSRRRWVYEYAKSLWGIRQLISRSTYPAVVIQVWPVVGYWDYVLLRLLTQQSRTLIVFHDPHPLVSAIGYGRVARWIASRPVLNSAAIVHSDAAADAVQESTNLQEVDVLPHPMFPPEKRVGRNLNDVTIRVLGQYKVDRDIQGMEQLAAQGPAEWSYQAIGRGWPSIAGWEIIDQFVKEDEFDSYLRSSSAIMIPYIRFFQSGVAIRSLEVSTPVVGPRKSSLSGLLGTHSDWLVDDESWIVAVKAAIRSEPEEVYGIASSIYEDTLRQWKAWLDSTLEKPQQTRQF